MIVGALGLRLSFLYIKSRVSCGCLCRCGMYTHLHCLEGGFMPVFTLEDLGSC